MNRMDDLISREWLVDGIEQGRTLFETERDYNWMIHLVRDIAPSARIESDYAPGEKQQRMDDLISRQAAIDLVDKYFKLIELNGDICIDGLITLPSASQNRK